MINLKEQKKNAQAILNARALYPDSSLTDLYDELTMPVELRRAHQANDKAVMEAYDMTKIVDGKKTWLTESFLFRPYNIRTSFIGFIEIYTLLNSTNSNNTFVLSINPSKGPNDGNQHCRKKIGDLDSFAPNEVDPNTENEAGADQ